MRRWVLMMLSAVLSGNVAAEWELAASSNSDALYIEHATIGKLGSTAKMWSLIDSKTAKLIRGKPYLSLRTQREYDCNEVKVRDLHATWHSGNMGKGDVTDTNPNPSSWASVAPRSGNELLWKIACGKS